MAGRLARDETSPTSDQTVPWIDRAVVIGHLFLIMTVAAALRVRDLDRYSLWYDEVITMRLARTANPAELIALLRQIDGTRAPLHPLLLQGWLRAFGSSELAARSFSAVCGMLTVVAVYFLGRRLFDERTGRWAAWFTAVCPPLVYYSQEARMYAWLVLLTCLSWLVFVRFYRAADGRAMALYGILLTALVYSHPLGLFMVAAHGLAYLLVRKSLALGFRWWLAIQAAVALAIAPWIPRYLDHGTDYPLPVYSLRFLLAVPIEYVGGNSVVLLACMMVIAFGLVARERRRFFVIHVPGEPDAPLVDDPPAGRDVRLLPGRPADLRAASLSHVHCPRLPAPAGEGLCAAAESPETRPRGGGLRALACRDRRERLQPGREGRLARAGPLARPAGILRAERVGHPGCPSERPPLPARPGRGGPVLPEPAVPRLAGRKGSSEISGPADTRAAPSSTSSVSRPSRSGRVSET